MAPSVCFVCGSCPPGAVYVDTMRNFNPPNFTNRNGRIYVCSDCIRDLAHATGVFDGEREKAAALLAEAEDRSGWLQSRLDDLKHLEDVVSRFVSTPSGTGLPNDPNDPGASGTHPETTGEPADAPTEKPTAKRTTTRKPPTPAE